MGWAEEVQYERRRAARVRGAQARTLQKKGQPLDLMNVNTSESTLAQATTLFVVAVLFKNGFIQKQSTQFPLNIVVEPCKRVINFFNRLGKSPSSKKKKKTATRSLSTQQKRLNYYKKLSAKMGQSGSSFKFPSTESSQRDKQRVPPTIQDYDGY